MSSRNRKSASTKMRGPSRPVDPRRAPGARQVRRGPDTFGMLLIGFSTLFVLVIIFFLTRAPSTVTTTTAPSTSGNNGASSAPTAAPGTGSAGATQTAEEVSFLSQTA